MAKKNQAFDYSVLKEQEKLHDEFLRTKKARAENLVISRKNKVE